MVENFAASINRTEVIRNGGDCVGRALYSIEENSVVPLEFVGDTISPNEKLWTVGKCKRNYFFPCARDVKVGESWKEPQKQALAGETAFKLEGFARILDHLAAKVAFSVNCNALGIDCRICGFSYVDIETNIVLREEGTVTNPETIGKEVYALQNRLV